MSLANLTWRFEAADELTAANVLEVLVGFNAVLVLVPKLSLEDDSVGSVTSVAITPSTGLALSGARVSDDKRSIEIDGVASVVGDYVVVTKFIAVEGGTRLRRSLVTVQSVTGT